MLFRRGCLSYPVLHFLLSLHRIYVLVQHGWRICITAVNACCDRTLISQLSSPKSQTENFLWGHFLPGYNTTCTWIFRHVHTDLLWDVTKGTCHTWLVKYGNWCKEQYGHNLTRVSDNQFACDLFWKNRIFGGQNHHNEPLPTGMFANQKLHQWWIHYSQGSGICAMLMFCTLCLCSLFYIYAIPWYAGMKYSSSKDIIFYYLC